MPAMASTLRSSLRTTRVEYTYTPASTGSVAAMYTWCPESAVCGATHSMASRVAASSVAAATNSTMEVRTAHTRPPSFPSTPSASLQFSNSTMNRA